MDWHNDSFNKRADDLALSMKLLSLKIKLTGMALRRKNNEHKKGPNPKYGVHLQRTRSNSSIPKN